MSLRSTTEHAPCNSLAQIEAEATLLAFSSAALHGCKFFHFEGDAKIILDPMIGPNLRRLRLGGERNIELN